METYLKIKKIITAFLCILFIYILAGCSKSQELDFTCKYIFGSCDGEIEGAPVSITKEEYSFENISNITFSSAKIFPQVLETEKAKYFEFKEERGGDVGKIYRSEIYLDCQYSKEIFDGEVERLSSIYTEWEKGNKNSVLSNDLFCFPTYITSYNSAGEFEYALFDNANYRVIYIYLLGVGSASNIVFEEMFIPQKKLNESDFDSTLISKEGDYTIYWS
ncbi:MAG: hypothetical protein K2H06_01695 [Anaeroplasmataceae bacterium]|nr:hypothetical protein [Anaeroplasmataceae bacterium]